jgi:hypothetical protein
VFTQWKLQQKSFQVVNTDLQIDLHTIFIK